MASFPTDQKWYNLGVILSTPLSLPMIVVGHEFAKLHGPGIAICSILVGNLILWLIGLAIISMSRENLSNAFDNARSYLGAFGAALMWVVMMASILNWFTLQLNANVPSIGAFLHITNPRLLVGVGTTLGIVTTLIAMGGIQVLKWMTLIGFPFVFLYYVTSIIQSDISINKNFAFGLSVSGVISTVLILLPGVINIPTLFRHTQSKADSFLGLSMLFFLISFYEISAIWMNFTDQHGFIITGFSGFAIASFLFLLLTLCSINVVNIYYLQALCESYFPRIVGIKGSILFGLIGTCSYTFINGNTFIHVVANFTNSFLGCLGIVLPIAYLVRMIIRHRPRKFERGLNTLCFVIGCGVSTWVIVTDVQNYIHSILMGCFASAASFLIIIFIEDNIWAIKKILSLKD